MCQRIQCDRCQKPGFAGCGMHVEQVLRDVPKEERCRCRETARESGGAGESSRWQFWKR